MQSLIAGDRNMKPDVRTELQIFKEQYPLAIFDCNKIAYHVDYFIPDLTGYRRYSPAECIIDNKRRNCEGKCDYFKENNLIKRFINWIYG